MHWHAVALDKNKPVPLYYQLVEAIREAIQNGELQAGEQLPSHQELSSAVAVSRMTARQAIAYLVREGALIVKPGVGTFVTEPKLTYDAVHLLGFSEEMMRRGGTVTSRVLEQRLVSPPARVAAELRLPPGMDAIKIARLRLAGGVPLLLETIYLPVSFCAGLEHEDLETQSLYAILHQKYRLQLAYARQTLEATAMNIHEAELFEIAPGTPVLLVEGVTYLQQGDPVEYFKACYRGDRFKFQLENSRDAVTEPAGAAPSLSVVLA
jgi:GntR family transcriptional regulator